jgi:hypothetical protein
MTHDHEAAQLAVASLDFELTPAERTRMEAGLAACPECAAIAASHIGLQGMLQQLPVHDASPIVRQRVMRAALVPPRRSQWQVLLVAAALLGLVLAGAAAVGAFRSQPIDQLTDVPSSSPPALGDVVSPEPSPSVDPSASPSDGGGSAFGAPLPHDSIAEVVSGRLRIRSQPRVADDSIKYEPLLGVGARLMILDGPVPSNDYDWYQVAAWDPKDPGASLPAGWVSRGDHDGTPWISQAADVCPTGEVTIADVVGLAPAERVACFGHRELRLRAFLTDGSESYACTADPGCTVDGPSWLTDLGGSTAEVDAQSAAAGNGPILAIDPDGALRDRSMPSGVMAILDGSFDAPAAQQCHALGGTSAGPTTDLAARLQCRARFVVHDVTVDPAYPKLGAAVTATDRLRVRSTPGLGGARYELLAKGTPVWVVDGPVVADDYEWFQVIVPSLEVDGAPRVGWVAQSDHGGERWLSGRRLDCPSPSDVTVADLARLMGTREPQGGLTCFGDQPITFKGEVEMSCGEARPTWLVQPDWLGPHALYTVAISDGTDVVNAHFRPELALPKSCGGQDTSIHTIQAHFDDGDAATCEAPTPGGTSASDAKALVSYWCRTALVVDSIDPMPGAAGS